MLSIHFNVTLGMGYKRKGLKPNQHAESNKKVYLSQDSKGYFLGTRVYRKQIPPTQKWDSKGTYLGKNKQINPYITNGPS